MPTRTNPGAIDPGRFRHQITLLEQVIGSDASGQVSSYTADTHPVIAWMEIRQMRGTDVVKSGQEVSQVILELVGWWRSEFTANKRVQTPGGAQYIIQAVENVLEKNEYMRLTCLGVSLNN